MREIKGLALSVWDARQCEETEFRHRRRWCRSLRARSPLNENIMMDRWSCCGRANIYDGTLVQADTAILTHKMHTRRSKHYNTNSFGQFDWTTNALAGMNWELREKQTNINGKKKSNERNPFIFRHRINVALVIIIIASAALLTRTHTHTYAQTQAYIRTKQFQMVGHLLLSLNWHLLFCCIL